MKVLKNSSLSEEFEGWDDDKIYEFDDGTKWKLASYTYSYSYSYRPKAKLLTDGSRYYLEVEGMGAAVEVIQIY
ncbi:TPA: hypothetical protein PXN30_002632 [Yersinia enterocolitica]|uniref:hypothetical protein n=1 Tax=Yersinia enterocolitica TaxID=630 RepID=UPI0027F3AC0D|nr:hypothetical protein [Yersinia enterocolitica]EKN4110602.1 hypothetical protein [Yersinia enterocolitica]HDL7180526.1 hypothetical protein [Yersinia enterocolitica]HDL7410984.1 hypothetical protein [Yersinia enterocolitica]HDL8099863.1 hypothetical protein [Yersinia enterocolitica]